MKKSEYPELDQLFSVYLNQDFDIWGDSLGEIVDCYKRDSPVEDHRSLIAEIDRFRKAHPDDLEVAFKSRYGYDIAPEPWGHTTASFLDELKRLLTNSRPEVRMLSDTRYANLGQLIAAYFGEDSGLSGSNVMEIVACYKRESSQATRESVLREIDMFMRDNRLELDAGLRTCFKKSSWVLLTARQSC